MELKVYYSAKGDDDYKLHRLKKPRTPMCDAINDDYRAYFMTACNTSTDLPNSEDGDICPLFEQVRQWKGNQFSVLL